MAHAGFLREVARFAFPAGTAAAPRRALGYLFALNVVQVPLVEARTVATTVLVAVGLYLVLALEARDEARAQRGPGLCAGALRPLYVLMLALGGRATSSSSSCPGWSRLRHRRRPALAITGLWLDDERFVADLGA